MATDSKNVALVPLNGKNYSTWKVQCRMALMRDGLWDIVNNKEKIPTEGDKDILKFLSRRDRALATIVLSVDPSLLYLIGDPDDPVIVWNKLADQFQKKTWANKLALRRKLYSLRLKDGDSVQEHVKVMIEIFDSLAAVGDPVKEEDRVVHLLASLPDSYGMLVTALEANAEVPKMEIVTERLLHEESKLKERAVEETGLEIKAMTSQHRASRRGPKCFECGGFGHIRKNCGNLSSKAVLEGKERETGVRRNKHKAHKAQVKERDPSSSDSEATGLVASHALTAGSMKGEAVWIVDSGATCHMCSDRKLFVNFNSLAEPRYITLGDGHTVKAVGRGVVLLRISTDDVKTNKCKLQDVLYVPKLSFNLLSVVASTKAGMLVQFTEGGCEIFDGRNKLVATATRESNLYYLNCCSIHVLMNSVGQKECVWHQRYGHLCEDGLKKLVKGNMVDGLDFGPSTEVSFCESRTEGKIHRSKFPVEQSKRADEELGLVHTDVCGKVGTKSLSGGEYFLTFIDDKTRYVWVYTLKTKDEVFQKFVEWKALVEKSTSKRLKVLRSDNGGEYLSSEFRDYLSREGIRHELTIPKTPQQNGVAERMNRTLVESVRSMLIDAHLPHTFWAEALSTAVYLRNRSPTKAVKDKTPYEAWSGDRPNVKHLRVFGCIAYAYVPKDERKKLDSKSRKCILLGYGAEIKGYRLYDVERRKVLHSRDVIFDESSRLTISGERQGKLQCEEGEKQRLVEFEFDCTPNEVEEEPEPVLRRSTRERRPPDNYGEWVTVADSEGKEPETMKQALSGPSKPKWQEAMEKEMESLHCNDVWELVELPKDRKAVGNKWVFKIKTDADGSVERYKARLVAQGYTQKFGLDYDETFSPVVRFESVRTVVALAAQQGLKLHQMDVTCAFLNGELEEEIYMKQPEGFEIKGKEHLVCKLRRSIYGLKQSPRCWNTTLNGKLERMGFSQTKGDPCIYTAQHGEPFIIGVYVDDILLASKSDKRLAEVKATLADEFHMKDMGELHHFLGVKIIQRHETGEIWMGQSVYTRNVLEKLGMTNSKPMPTPVDVSTKLVKGDDSKKVDKAEYQSMVGSLLYLSTRTRPDIAYAVSNVSRFNAEPTTKHMTAVKRILRYLNGTCDLGLLYRKDEMNECIGYSDADWAGDLDDRKSTSAYIFHMGGTAISWRSKRQACVALSTAEAEYMALASAAQEALWLRQLLSDLKNKPTSPTLILEDNQAAICLAKNPQFHGHAKHIDIKYHFVREQVANGNIAVKYCRSEDMLADMLTKGLSYVPFTKLREMTGVKAMTE